MFKTVALSAIAAVCSGALAQSTQSTTQQSTTTTTTTNQATGKTQQTTTTTTTTNAPVVSSDDWRVKYDSYHIGTCDLNTINPWEIRRIAFHNMRDLNAADQYTLRDFLMRLPGDQEYVICKALVNNWKEACTVRDEVAQARFGTEEPTYAWISYPPLTWGTNPGESSWSSQTFMQPNGTTTTTTTTVTETTAEQPLETSITMTDDQTRPMRMIMADWKRRGDIDYDRAVDILCKGMDSTDRGVISEVFHPRQDDPLNYTNAEALDAIIDMIRDDAMMVHYLNRWSWYNHFDPNYYSRQTFEEYGR